jgi:Beta-propeller repeat
MKATRETKLTSYGKHGFALGTLVLLCLTLVLPITVTKRGVFASTAKSEATRARRGVPDQGPHARPASGSVVSQTRLAKSYGQLPLSFERNRGQTDGRVKFLARGQGYALFLTRNEAVLDLTKPIHEANGKTQKDNVMQRSPVKAAAPPGLFRLAASDQRRIAQLPIASRLVAPEAATRNGLRRTKEEPQTANTVLRMKLVGANPNARVIATDELPGKSNYLVGNDPKKWRTNVPNYARVEYRHVYPGVNLVYYGNQGQLEYDFVVAPGADPSQIAIELRTVQSKIQNPKSKIDGNGDLLVQADAGEVRFHKPVVYQMQSAVDSRKSTVQQQSAPAEARNKELRTKNLLDGSYILKGNQVTFKVAFYDRSKPLVIDPVLKYSTFLGGSGDDLVAPAGTQGIAVDPQGNAYVIGATDSIDFPTTSGAFQRKFAAGSGVFGCFSGIAADAFVTKLNATGDAVLYSTYLGGSDDDCGEGIAVDSAGNAYVAGETLSGDFPITKGAFQPACASCSNGLVDTFAAKLSPDGSALTYSTYIGGNGEDLFPMIVIDRVGNMYIEGSTFSTDYPTTPAAFQRACASCANGAPDIYVTKLNPTATRLVYSTYLGGTDWEFCGAQIAVDRSGNAYVNGFTCSTDFPTHNPLQAPAGGCDAFLAKLNPAGNLVYSTYLGGNDFDFIWGTTVDFAGNAYVSGFTFSTDFPTTPGAFQTNFVGGSNCPDPPCPDAFVTKINPSGRRLVYSTYLGGNGDDNGAEIVADSDGNAYVSGHTSSTDFPTLNPLQPVNAGGYDIFVTKLNAAGSALIYSTYLGGSGDEFNHGTAIDSRRNIYLAGPTTSNNFPTVNAAQPQFGGGTWDAFVAKISPDNPSANAPGLALSQPNRASSGAERPRLNRTMPDLGRKIDMARKLAH